MLDRARVARGRHCVWPRGVETDVFSPAQRSTSLREQWLAGRSGPIIAYAGRISREKQLDNFVGLDERLRAARLDCRFVFVGDGPMRAELEERMPNAVFTGAVPHIRVAEYLASADIFAFPSHTDTAGNVVLEAQACGLPAVVSSEGGPAENVINGETGIVTGGPGRPSFAGAVEHLVRRREQRLRMGVAARQYAHTRTWPKALASLFECYREFGRPPGEAALTSFQLAKREG